MSEIHAFPPSVNTSSGANEVSTSSQKKDSSSEKGAATKLPSTNLSEQAVAAQDASEGGAFLNKPIENSPVRNSTDYRFIKGKV
jgi:hypothetical protein